MNWGIVAGDTDKTIYVRLRDATTGLAKTGLVFNSAGAVCSYVLPLAARAAITLATQTVTGAHTDGGFVEVDATNCKGLYRLDLPDAAIASGDFSIISIEFDGIIEESIQIALTPQVSTVAAIADGVWDEVLTGAAHNVVNSAGRRLRQLQEAGGYDGYIWIDTVNGTAGTTSFENGTSTNPVDSIADANTLAAALNLNRFFVYPGSSITFAAAQQSQVFHAQGATIALGGQNIVGTTIIGGTVSGIAAGVGTTQYFIDCLMNACSHIKGTHLIACGIAGTQTVVEAGDFFLDRCHSAIAGTGTWVFDFGGLIGNTNLNVRNYSGGIQLENMGDTGTDTASIEGQGQLIEGTCTGGTVAVRGLFTTSGITNLTLSDDARWDVTQQQAADITAVSGSPSAATKMEEAFEAVITGTVGVGSTTTAIVLSSTDPAFTVNDQPNGKIVTFKEATTTAALRGQSTDITDYDQASATLTVTALTTAPVNGDTFVIT